MDIIAGNRSLIWMIVWKLGCVVWMWVKKKAFITVNSSCHYIIISLYQMVWGTLQKIWLMLTVLMFFQSAPWKAPAILAVGPHHPGAPCNDQTILGEQKQGVPSRGVPQNACFTRENSNLKWMMTGGTPMTQETTKKWHICIILGHLESREIFSMQSCNIHSPNIICWGNASSWSWMVASIPESMNQLNITIQVQAKQTKKRHRHISVKPEGPRF